MIENTPNFDMALFERLYHDLLDLKMEIEEDPKINFQSHEWIDIDEVINKNLKKNRQNNG